MNCRACALYLNKAAEEEWEVEGGRGGGEGEDHNDKRKNL